MKTTSLLILAVSLCFCFLGPGKAVSGDQEKPPAAGEIFPPVSLSIPESADHRSYLGLAKDTGTFDISNIRADMVIIEIFSMYCPFCQQEAPEVNKLYAEIKQRPGLQGRIKIIGVGAGNSAYEVDVFRKTYKIPFPLIPDPDFEIYAVLGKVRTPYFFAVRINPQGPGRVLYANPGGLGGASRFLEEVSRRLAEKLPED